VRIDDYSAFVLLHTKKSRHFSEKYSENWRNSLVDPLLGTRERIASNLALMASDKSIGIIGAAAWRHKGVDQNAMHYRYLLQKAGIDPADVSLAEVYDLSTALELDWIEDIGLCKRGEAESLLRAGDTTIGGRIPVNPSGGLACFGEAVPAQALAQVCEVTWQLRGQATGRQVEGARVGITANQGLFGHGSSVLLSV